MDDSNKEHPKTISILNIVLELTGPDLNPSAM
jgi:hypothetical protein